MTKEEAKSRLNLLLNEAKNPYDLIDAIYVDSVSIKGMKRTDFDLLQNIFYDFKEKGVYWGRKDYFDKNMKSLEDFVNRCSSTTNERRIKEK